MSCAIRSRKSSPERFKTGITVCFAGVSFSNADELKSLVAQALHHHALAQATQLVNVGELVQVADNLLPQAQRGYSRDVGTLLQLALVGSPSQTILRPAQPGDPTLVRSLIAQLTQHELGYFSYRLGTKDQLHGSALILSQPNRAALQLSEDGSLLLSVPVEADKGMFGGLIEEHVAAAIKRGLAFADVVLEQIDPTQKLVRMVLAADIEAAGLSVWRTLEENRRNPDSGTMGWRQNDDSGTPIHLQPADRPRAALKADRQRIAEDLLTLLRRKFRDRTL